jgi:RNA 2',3'-cyclic 3'-phosphodiesterase
MRIFVGLDIDDAIRSRISTFMDGVREFASEARWTRVESLHVTVKFIGEQPAEKVDKIKSALSTIKCPSFPVHFGGYGFFPTPKAARVFWIGIQSGPELTQLAAAVDAATLAIGIPKEDHPFSPHLTLARGGSGSPRKQRGDGPNRRFDRLQDKLSKVLQPEFGTMAAREFFLFESHLGPGGSRYSKLHRFPLTDR